MTPRALIPEEAAAYCGCKDVRQFKAEVERGHWPGPLPIASRPQRWDRAALDRRLDEISGLIQDPNEDPIMAAINDL